MIREERMREVEESDNDRTYKKISIYWNQKNINSLTVQFF